MSFKLREAVIPPRFIVVVGEGASEDGIAAFPSFDTKWFDSLVTALCSPKDEAAQFLTTLRCIICSVKGCIDKICKVVEDLVVVLGNDQLDQRGSSGRRRSMCLPRLVKEHKLDSSRRGAGSICDLLGLCFSVLEWIKRIRRLYLFSVAFKKVLKGLHDFR